MTEEDTFKRLKGLTKEQIESIIDKSFYLNLSQHERAEWINRQLAPYGWSYAKYIEYFY